jgi:diguanylate cyclase (GGDEF) domain
MIADPHQLYAQKLTEVYKRSRTAFIYTLLAGALLVSILLRELSLQVVMLWFAGLLLTSGIQRVIGRRYLDQEPSAAGLSMAAHITAAGLAGLGWGAAAILLLWLSLPLEMLVILILTSMAAIALPRLSPLPSLYGAYLLGIIAPLSLLLIFLPHDVLKLVLLVLIFVSAACMLSARAVHDDLEERLLSSFDLTTLAGEDKLTGIPNRRHFDERLDREWRRAARMRVPLSLILIDVDHFKKFNDRYGHRAGDECLMQVAQVLDGSVRHPGDLVARYGGEEFVVLLFHMTRDDAYAAAERLRLAVAQLALRHEDSADGQVSISLGGATQVPDGTGAAADLVQAADQALYEAKESGRNRVRWNHDEARW